jgi:hypothetical protein
MDADTLSRFLAKVAVRDGDACWEWLAYRDRHGYGQFKLDGVMQRAHRVSYRLLVGPLPTGLTLDHLCRNRGCVNPDHLDPVTNRENLLRGETVTARNAGATHCPAGHEYSGGNLRVTLHGGRKCRACHRDRERRRYWDRKGSE